MFINLSPDKIKAYKKVLDNLEKSNDYEQNVGQKTNIEIRFLLDDHIKDIDNLYITDDLFFKVKSPYDNSDVYLAARSVKLNIKNNNPYKPFDFTPGIKEFVEGIKNSYRSRFENFEEKFFKMWIYRELIEYRSDVLGYVPKYTTFTAKVAYKYFKPYDI